jgi:signal peptidase I
MIEFLEPKTKKSPPAIKEFIIEFIKIIIIALAIVIPVRYFLIQPFYVKGASMEPNFHDYEYLIIDEVSFRLRQPERGEIIVFHSPYNWHDYFIKRIIGLPGERVVINNGEVYIYNEEFKYGTKLDESGYLQTGIHTPGLIDQQIKEDEFFVMGDNRSASLDSRVFGAISRQQIVGRAWLRAWPLPRFEQFSLPNYNL